jgi:hypothetical protein
MDGKDCVERALEVAAADAAQMLRAHEQLGKESRASAEAIRTVLASIEDCFGTSIDADALDPNFVEAVKLVLDTHERVAAELLAKTDAHERLSRMLDVMKADRKRADEELNSVAEACTELEAMVTVHSPDSPPSQRLTAILPKLHSKISKASLSARGDEIRAANLNSTLKTLTKAALDVSEKNRKLAQLLGAAVEPPLLNKPTPKECLTDACSSAEACIDLLAGSADSDEHPSVILARKLSKLDAELAEAREGEHETSALLVQTSKNLRGLLMNLKHAARQVNSGFVVERTFVSPLDNEVFDDDADVDDALELTLVPLATRIASCELIAKQFSSQSTSGPSATFSRNEGRPQQSPVRARDPVSSAQTHEAARKLWTHLTTLVRVSFIFPEVHSREVHEHCKGRNGADGDDDVMGPSALLPESSDEEQFAWALTRIERLADSVCGYLKNLAIKATTEQVALRQAVATSLQSIDEGWDMDGIGDDGDTEVVRSLIAELSSRRGMHMFGLGECVLHDGANALSSFLQCIARWRRLVADREASACGTLVDAIETELLVPFCSSANADLASKCDRALAHLKQSQEVDEASVSVVRDILRDIARVPDSLNRHADRMAAAEAERDRAQAQLAVVRAELSRARADTAPQRPRVSSIAPAHPVVSMVVERAEDTRRSSEQVGRHLSRSHYFETAVADRSEMPLDEEIGIRGRMSPPRTVAATTPTELAGGELSPMSVGRRSGGRLPQELQKSVQRLHQQGSRQPHVGGGPVVVKRVPTRR